MTGPCSRVSRFRLQPWGLAVVLFLAGCQHSQLGLLTQGATPPDPKAENPPAPSTRAPARTAAGQEALVLRSRTQAYPPVQYPRAPQPAPRTTPARTPGQTPGSAAPAASGPATETAAVPSAKAGEPDLPSFLPFLTRPRPGARPQARARVDVPPPRSDKTVRVALLAPLSGANAGLGQAMLNAAQLALFHFADGHLELLVHDTKGTPRGAAEAASAAIGDGARMILGPLLATSAQAVRPAAAAANVPVVAFSSDRSVAGGGVYVMGFLPQAEIERIVAFARAKGIQRFAALAPENAYGETVVTAFERAVAAHGGRVTRVQFYDPGAEDFAPAVRRLADYDSRRQALMAQRRELEGREDEISRRALKRLENLQTIGEVPFDALLVADGGKRLQAVAALLPFYDIDPKKVRMLGTGQWDVPGIGAEPALVGGWFAAPPPPARAEFVDAYKSTYGAPPPRLATLAYDGTALAAVLAQGENGPDFSARALTVPSGFWGRDGIFRFLPEGTTERGLAVMRLRGRGAEVISRAPETFEARVN